MLNLETIVLGAADVRRAVEFWSRALGYVPRGAVRDDWAVLVPGDGVGPALALDLSETPAQDHPRVHIDLNAADAVDQAAEVDRLVSIGAERVDWDLYPEDPDFVVLADTEGNRFCVIDPLHAGPQSSAPAPPHLRALVRHFADLRDGIHGGETTLQGKEAVFARAVGYLDPYVRQALAELNRTLLLDTGTVEGTGVVRGPDGGLEVAWTVTWAQQRDARIDPVTIKAFYGHAFHHPHLCGGTVGNWPLNVFDQRDAAAELPTLRSIAAADLHNLVFQRDYRIVPATTAGAIS
ncbi:VOC family protein [Actinomadura alba]|uniref:VOC family protein n=1 Tax=Actinomadura alba TaxID=406431 RepID=A0ABR7LUL8_9ACTN|nr:VOC family protein [Actinomadura alba]MBC6468548.1 VOC family protein [Actinomadura alba]